MNIYVGNLALEMTEDELRQEFLAFGQVVSTSVMNDKYIGSGQPRAYGYVEMASKSEGTAAITCLTGKSLRGRPICVVEALPLSDKAGDGSFNCGTGNKFSGRRRQRITETVSRLA